MSAAGTEDRPTPPPSDGVRLTLEEFRATTMRQSASHIVMSGRPWVAKVVGRSERYGLEREFLNPIRDHGLAHPKGSRGVYCIFHLFPGEIYEVYSQIKWERWDRYFCRVKDSEIVRISAEEVLQCLNEG